MKTKILVIEDEEHIRDNLKLILEAESFDVITADNGYEGIKYAKIYKPNLIICDIMMPEINGYEVLTQLASDKNYNSIPFIFLTAKVERKDLRKGMELGADDYIFKPFTTKELIKAVKTRLAKYENIIKKVTLEDKTLGSENRINFEGTILIKYNRRALPIKVKNIISIKAENQYSLLHFASNKNYLIRKSLNEWLQILPGNYFIRISRSIIINKEFIENIEISENGLNSIITKITKESFRISRGYLKNFKSSLTML